MKEPLKQISDLVERFERNIEAYHNPAYNETQLRIEFVDPFFEALGWDVTNKAGYAEQYKDVSHEDAIKIAGATKAPDYCFRIGAAHEQIKDLASLDFRNTMKKLQQHVATRLVQMGKELER